MSTRGSSHALMRLVLSLLGLAVFLALDGPAAKTVAGANLSRTIASTRHSQSAAEASMRQADRRLKSLERALRLSRKRLKAATHRLARLEERHEAVRLRAEAASGQLALARLILKQEHEPPDPTATTPVDSALADMAAWAGARLAALEDDQEDRTDRSVAGQRDGLPSGDTPASPELRRLESEVGRSRRLARKLGRKTRRAERARVALVRMMPRIRYQMVATMRHREGSEAVLGRYIESMSRLAHHRVANKTEPRNWSGFTWPIRGRISQRYHGGHDGLDIVASRGAPIRAMAIGVVAFVGWNPWDRGRRAFVVVLAHPKGYETVYGHLLPIRRVMVGQVVKKGQLIGHMGNTGHSTGVHLHIEVRRGFRTMDPMAVL